MTQCISFKQNGKILFLGNWIGVWSYDDIWASQGKYDASGNRLVKGFYKAWLVNGKTINYCYTRNELKERIASSGLYELARTASHMTDKHKMEAIAQC